jgi:hypothetical protein
MFPVARQLVKVSVDDWPVASTTSMPPAVRPALDHRSLDKGIGHRTSGLSGKKTTTSATPYTEPIIKGVPRFNS